MWIELNQDQRTRFTRKCIAEAIVLLLAGTEFDKLKISAIVKRAGISRMTFYKYYECPKDALKDYLRILISEYLEESKIAGSGIDYRTYEHILFSFEFFDRYRTYFLTLQRCGLYSIMIDAVNEFMLKHIHTRNQETKYELYSYAGGLLNTFLEWERHGKKHSSEDVARHIYRLYGKNTQESQND